MFFHPYLFLFCPVLKAKSCQKSTRKYRKSNIGMKIVPNWRLWLQKKTGLWELLLCGLAPYLFLPGRNKTKQNYYEVFIFHSVNMTKNILIMSNCKISGCWGVGGDKAEIKGVQHETCLEKFSSLKPSILAKKFWHQVFIYWTYLKCYFGSSKVV